MLRIATFASTWVSDAPVPLVAPLLRALGEVGGKNDLARLSVFGLHIPRGDIGREEESDGFSGDIALALPAIPGIAGDGGGDATPREPRSFVPQNSISTAMRKRI